MLIAGSLLNGPTLAQLPPAGQIMHDKLAQTQRDYQAAMATGDSERVAQVCYEMGKRYGAFGEYATAEKWFVRSLRIREPLGPSELIGKTYLRIAEDLVRQQQYQPAMHAVRQGLSHVRAVNSRHGLMSAYIVLAGVHGLGRQLNHEKSGSAPTASLDSAIHYLDQAERLALALNKPLDIALVYMCKATALPPKDAELALRYLKKAYTVHRNTKEPNGMINSSLALANYYLSLRQPVVAKTWLDQAALVRDTAHHGAYWQNSLLDETYARLYQQTGNWQRAFVHREKYHAYQLAALNADRDGAVARIAAQYESEKKEMRLQAQQKNLITQQRLTLAAVGLLIVAIVVGGVFYWLFQKYRRISEHNARLVKEQNHRVKNNLQSVTSLLGLQFNRLTDPLARQALEESLLRIEAMALVHRRLYDGDRLVEVDLSQFIPELVDGVLHSYSIGHIRPVYALSTVWLGADVAINLGLLLNELVTNSCKYALANHPAPTLEIGCRYEQGRFRLWFADNGPGFDRSQSGQSFGMSLIAMITEKLKASSQFTTRSGCQFTLSFVPKPAVVPA